MLVSQLENKCPRQVTEENVPIEQEIECPRCHDVMTLCSEFDRLVIRVIESELAFVLQRSMTIFGDPTLLIAYFIPQPIYVSFQHWKSK